MIFNTRIPTLFLLAISLPAFCMAQPPGTSREKELVEQFDADKDGMLNAEERAAARVFIKESAQNERRPRGRAPSTPPEPGIRVSPEDVQPLDGELYDESILRTFFLDFANEEWEAELADFYRSDVYVPATLTVDGKVYEDVGVSFRGNSSFFTVSNGQKRSLNLTLDFRQDRQNLMGYRTLNLLNSHTDPSFQHEVLFNHVARKYTAAPLANYVRLIINGESWGVYINAQQLNRDFVEQWFGDRDTVRWKVPAGGGQRALNYAGEDKESYASYELKSADSDQVWKDLIELCRLIEETPPAELESIDGRLNIDRALWFLALDNLMIDGDGYYTRGSDYFIAQDTHYGRFHVLPYDSNETFRQVRTRRGGGRGAPQGGRRGGPPPGDPPPGARPGGQGGQRGGGGPPNSGTNIVDESGDGYGLNPLVGADNPRLPLLHKLLENPNIKARYLAHVRTLTNEVLDWDKTGPTVNSFYELIKDEVEADTKKLYPTDAFLESVESRNGDRDLKSFFQKRREYLLSLPELSASVPAIESVELSTTRPAANQPVTVFAKIANGNQPDEVILHVAGATNAPFDRFAMNDGGKDGDAKSGDGIYSARIMPRPGFNVSLYVEANAVASEGTTTFMPTNTEVGAIRISFPVATAKATNIVISEVMPANATTIQDSAGEYDDWIELTNVADVEIDLTGMYLTDNESRPRKWRFPDGTVIKPGERILVWADEDEDQSGLHANFKLSKTEEMVLLIDADARGNQILDRIEWQSMRDDISIGRSAGSENVIPLDPTPGEANGRN